MDIKRLTIKETHEGLKSKQFSAHELTEEIYLKIEKDDESLRAYISIDKDGALKSAASIDI